MRLLVSSEGGAENSLNAPVAAAPRENPRLNRPAAVPCHLEFQRSLLGLQGFPAHSVPADSAVASFHRPFGVA